ncbi:MAG: anti-sigma factor [Chitinophagaceae bacterium]
MNLKEYISSGIIESYVLGISTDAEREEFEQMCQQHPEVEQARTQFEIALENQLQLDAVAPPIQIKQQVLAALNSIDSVNTSEAKEKGQTPVRRLSAWKLLAAACLILLAGVAFWAVTLNNKYQQETAANASLKDQLAQASTEVAELRLTAQTLQNPALKNVSMQGTQMSPGSFANIYWDSTSKDVYLLVNNMPKPASDKQYQLWAIIDGKPVDLGVIDEKVWDKKLLVQMKNVQNAQAFAITLEPEGGSPAPRGSMYVMGKL